MKLTSSFEDFQTNIKLYLTKTAEFEKQNISTEQDIQNLNQAYLDWKKEVLQFLRDAFDEKENDFVQSFSSSSNSFSFPGVKIDVSQRANQLKTKIQDKKNELNYYIKLVSISDIFLGSITDNERENISTKEILDLILFKLYQLYDNSYHSIKLIADVNGIIFKKYGEERELTKILEQKGLVNVQYMRDVQAQLNANGKIYVEENLLKSSVDYTKISDDQDIINSKIDGIIKNLEKLGFGQEVIFNELSEMKDMFQHLDKKNWGQLLKGKLFDLGIEQVINKDTLSYIYKELTEQILHLK